MLEIGSKNLQLSIFIVLDVKIHSDDFQKIFSNTGRTEEIDSSFKLKNFVSNL